MSDLILAALTTWVVSTTVARSKLLSPIREWVATWSPTLFEGISCQYCISHWIGLAATLLWLAVNTNVSLPAAIFAWGAITGGSALIGKVLEVLK